MKIAIHIQRGSLSDGWIKYCEKFNIPYKIVNGYKSDIVDQLRDCAGILWHWVQTDYKSMLFAKQLTLAIKELGIKSYPDVDTCWHFDDKVGQKYLLEAIKAPLVPSYVFYSKMDALNWVRTTTFPKVFKLRGGAGSVNVRLVKSKKQAIRLIRKAFLNGFKHINRQASFRDKIIRFKEDKNWNNLIGIFKGFARFLIPNEEEKMSAREKGYIYFQDFIPNNKYDIRLVVIGHRCFGVKRFNRKNDFRASGSNNWDSSKESLNINCVKLAFALSKKLKIQSLAFDFLQENNNFLLVEISYCFPPNACDDLPGYYDDNLNWHNEEVNPSAFVIEDFIKSIHS